mmetsp:Transcript_21038/g.23538  ORF Transcript_21038/g.23538 Transcript_21038/m.23538 type:complete len:87 (+) Transcript_21038:34-294(+)
MGIEIMGLLFFVFLVVLELVVVLVTFTEADIIGGDYRNNNNEDKDKDVEDENGDGDDDNEDADDGNDENINHNDNETHKTTPSQQV